MGTVGCDRIRYSAFFLEQSGRAVEPSQFWSVPGLKKEPFPGSSPAKSTGTW